MEPNEREIEFLTNVALRTDVATSYVAANSDLDDEPAEQPARLNTAGVIAALIAMLAAVYLFW
jgi:hypothetical protein